MAEEEWIPGSKSELMSAIRSEWNHLMDVVQKLDEQKMTTPDEGGWSPKDNLAHLSEWMNSMMGYHIDKRPAHEVMRLTEDQTRDWDMEVINPVLFQRNKDRSIEDVLEELKQSPEVVSVLQGMRVASAEGRGEKPQYGLTTTTLILLRGKALNLTGAVCPSPLA